MEYKRGQYISPKDKEELSNFLRRVGKRERNVVKYSGYIRGDRWLSRPIPVESINEVIKKAKKRKRFY